MVYVVERYLPGLHRSDLLSGLSRLEPMRAGTGAGAEVRYLGSTIVLRDEACFCRFEGPSSDAVAEVNRQAGLPFNRIVPAVTVHPKGAEMSAYPSIPATVQIKRGRLIGLVAAAAVLAAGITWALVAVAFASKTSTSVSRPQAQIASLPAAEAHTVPSITAVTPARLAAGALGLGYALPTEPTGPTIEAVLASLSPQTREYTKRIMSLTFAQLAAGSAGSP
jgi:hypothetical protein